MHSIVLSALYYCRSPQTVAFNGARIKAIAVRIRACARETMTGMDDSVSVSLIVQQQILAIRLDLPQHLPYRRELA